MIQWQQLQSSTDTEISVKVYRAKVLGGWLVLVMWSDGGSTTFYPDPQHQWNGSSLPNTTGYL